MRASSLTTHEVAALLEVSPSAVLTWIAKGWLNAHRTPGGHRRVATLDLVRFLRGRRMPVPAVLTAVERLLFIDDDPVFLRNRLRGRKQGQQADHGDQKSRKRAGTGLTECSMPGCSRLPDGPESREYKRGN